MALDILCPHAYHDIIGHNYYKINQTIVKQQNSLGEYNGTLVYVLARLIWLSLPPFRLVKCFSSSLQIAGFIYEQHFETSSIIMIVFHMILITDF